jgi:flagellar protein FliO/FliZ
MVGGFYYFFRFVTKKAGIQMGGGGVAQTLSVVPLGQNKFLQIIDLAGRVLILGVSDASISLIGEIKDKDEIDRIRLLGSRVTPVQPGGFQEFLAGQIGKLLKRVKGGPPSGGAARFAPAGEDENMERLEYIARQRERLKRMNGMNDEE